MLPRNSSGLIIDKPAEAAAVAPTDGVVHARGPVGKTVVVTGDSELSVIEGCELVKAIPLVTHGSPKLRAAMTPSDD
jgi:hypothetical protein